jgi:proline-specific peptidase
MQIRDTRLFIEERGSGSPLIALHGGPGADHTQLLDPLAPLQDEFRLLFVDQRSQGHSDPAPRETWTLEDAARDVSDLAEMLGLDQYCVLGHSYGALVALQHAVDHPRHAAATVLSHGVPSTRWYRLREELEQLDPPEVRQEVEAAWQQLESASDAAQMTELIARQAPFHFKDPEGPFVAEEADRYRQQMTQTPEVNQYMSSHALSRFDLEEALVRIAQPVLVLSGRFERTCPLEAAEFMADRIPNADLYVFENSAHVSYVEERATYLAVVRAFLRRHLSR